MNFKFNKRPHWEILNKDNLELPVWLSCECYNQMVLLGKEGKVTMGSYKELRLKYESHFSAACTGTTVSWKLFVVTCKMMVKLTTLMAYVTSGLLAFNLHHCCCWWMPLLFSLVALPWYLLVFWPLWVLLAFLYHSSLSVSATHVSLPSQDLA